MDGSAISAADGHDKRTGRLLPGHTEYAARKRRIAARLEALVEEFDPSPAMRDQLAIIAGLHDDAERGRSLATRIRASNAARRLLAAIPRKPPPPIPTLEETIEMERKANG